MKTAFAIGDRVALIKPSPPDCPAPRTHGIIVFRHGKHNPRNPRVRWADGWGVTMKPSHLRRLTADELKQPPPATYECDQP